MRVLSRCAGLAFIVCVEAMSLACASRTAPPDAPGPEVASPEPPAAPAPVPDPPPPSPPVAPLPEATSASCALIAEPGNPSRPSRSASESTRRTHHIRQTTASGCCSGRCTRRWFESTARAVWFPALAASWQLDADRAHMDRHTARERAVLRRYAGHSGRCAGELDARRHRSRVAAGSESSRPDRSSRSTTGRWRSPCEGSARMRRSRSPTRISPSPDPSRIALAARDAVYRASTIATRTDRSSPSTTGILSVHSVSRCSPAIRETFWTKESTCC